jgi:hypothetical protein
MLTFVSGVTHESCRGAVETAGGDDWATVGDDWATVGASDTLGAVDGATERGGVPAHAQSVRQMAMRRIRWTCTPISFDLAGEGAGTACRQFLSGRGDEGGPASWNVRHRREGDACGDRL